MTQMNIKPMAKMVLIFFSLCMAAACDNDNNVTGETPSTHDMGDALADMASMSDISQNVDATPDGDATTEPDISIEPECTSLVQEPDTFVAPEIYTPRWAFEPWISKDISDGPDTYAFVKGFKDRDIPVGIFLIGEVTKGVSVPSSFANKGDLKLTLNVHAYIGRIGCTGIGGSSVGRLRKNLSNIRKKMIGNIHCPI